MWKRFVRCTSILAAALVLQTASVAFADEKRPPQDYGGVEQGTTAGDVALWVPRVVLFPLWLISEYAIRIPVGALVRAAERGQWPHDVIEFFTFGDRGQVTIFPSALFDFGLLPSVGFNARWKYFLAEKNAIGLHFGTWGPEWIATRLVDRYDLRKDEAITTDASFVRRQDEPFYGMGPRSRGGRRLRFQSTTVDGALAYEKGGWRSSKLTLRAGVRSLAFGDGSCCGDDSLDYAVAAHEVAAPPGFGDGYVAGYQRAAITFDSRRPRPAEGSGVRVEAHAETAFAPDSAGPRGWVRYGGSAGAALDLTKTERVVSLTVDGELADPITGVVPFTEQVSLGGDLLMRGYLRNRLIDRSALVATLKYTWPIWVFLDGVIHVDVGDVFGPEFQGFTPGLLRATAGLGVRSNGARESGFELLVAGGTDPFEQGFSVSSFRLVIGSHHGF